LQYDLNRIEHNNTDDCGVELSAVDKSDQNPSEKFCPVEPFFPDQVVLRQVLGPRYQEVESSFQDLVGDGRRRRGVDAEERVTCG
jgi:hypothetical protein